MFRSSRVLSRIVGRRQMSHGPVEVPKHLEGVAADHPGLLYGTNAAYDLILPRVRPAFKDDPEMWLRFAGPGRHHVVYFVLTFWTVFIFSAVQIKKICFPAKKAEEAVVASSGNSAGGIPEDHEAFLTWLAVDGNVDKYLASV